MTIVRLSLVTVGLAFAGFILSAQSAAVVDVTGGRIQGESLAGGGAAFKGSLRRTANRRPPLARAHAGSRVEGHTGCDGVRRRVYPGTRSDPQRRRDCERGLPHAQHLDLAVAELWPVAGHGLDSRRRAQRWRSGSSRDGWRKPESSRCRRVDVQLPARIVRLLFPPGVDERVATSCIGQSGDSRPDCCAQVGQKQHLAIRRRSRQRHDLRRVVWRARCQHPHDLAVVQGAVSSSDRPKWFRRPSGGAVVPRRGGTSRAT